MRVFWVSGVLSGLSALALGVGCTSQGPSGSESATPSPEAAEAKLISRGRAVYAANCTACHNSDPSRPGALGPDVKGSSRALLEARILRAEYPPGYTPKRRTGQMNKMPQLAAELDALAAFLSTP